MSLLLVKMLIPAMATGGITMEIEATHVLDIASLFDRAPAAVYAEAGMPQIAASSTAAENAEAVACCSQPVENTEDVSNSPALHLIRFKEDIGPNNNLEYDVKLPETALA